MPVKVTYLAGRDINTDTRQAGIVTDIAKKMTAIDVIRSSDFGGAVVSGMDRVNLESRVTAWQEEIADKLDVKDSKKFLNSPWMKILIEEWEGILSGYLGDGEGAGC